ncbi:hypothetical protein FJT64_025276 [Amphibalanus amphitrite]|uniref:Fibrinogen C-terminal domain-containing protein n=1 Tax=Amphibalanus amphitrite TaxID=1232801 RepID=A0A6A4WKC2_AMPAM|nr:hypothetical protein FJT64_025276 [Amphibalanus amphitrite]
MRRWLAPVLSALLLLAVHVPPSAAEQLPTAADQLPSAADQLAALLGPVVEAAVSRAMQGGADAGQRALVELGRLEGRLDAAVHGLAELQLQFGRLEGRLEAAADQNVTCQCSPQQNVKTEELQPVTEEQEPFCETSPARLLPGLGPYWEPERRACARSCLQLRDQGGSPRDGVYWFTGMPVPVLCDFSHDGGGWTLLLTVAAREGWNSLSVLRRSERSPSLTSNYAILARADAIRDLGTGSRFAYRIEAQAETGRRRWGGVWLAPRHYSFVHEAPTQTSVSRAAKFNNWEYKDTGIEQRMPWLNMGAGSAVLTTSASATTQWFGTLVTHETNTGYTFSPWIHEQAVKSGRVLYWMREEML